MWCWLHHHKCRGKMAWLSAWFQNLSGLFSFPPTGTRYVSHLTQLLNTFTKFNGYNLCFFFFESGQFSGVLLGDKGYACLPYLLTPYQETQTEAQHNYNVAHARTRARIEMAFGLIKSRFQCLNYLRVIPQRACDIVVACVVLHNIACLRRERQPRMVVQEDWDIEGTFDDNEIGRVIRDRYANNYFG